MSILTAEGLYKSYGAQVVLEDVGMILQPGERVGLLGINGAGKSTLAKILAGAEVADSGTMQLKKGATVSYFSQEPNLPPEQTAREIVAAGLGQWQRAYSRYEKISADLSMGKGDMDALLAEQERCAELIETHGGWERSHQVETVLEHLGVIRRDAPAGELSGGEQRRVALARLLVAQPDLAILDEPTNHLDVETIEWLEQQFIHSFQGTLLFITHDRYMLDRVAQRIVEIDHSVMHSYRGGWDAYLEAKAERAAHGARTEANRQNYLRRELEWLSRSPQARTTKQKARIKRVESVRDQDGPNQVQEAAKLAIQQARTGRTIIDITELRLELGGKVLIEKLDLCLAKGDRIGIVGRNGAGKTSLLRAIIGDLPPVSGHIELGATMKVAYFDQTRANLDPEASIFENVIGNRSDIRMGKEVITAHAYLGRFQFPRVRVNDKVKMLSGGERARVALAKLLIEPVNLLLLDEPTNDLDVVTLGALEEMLISTGATAIVVTHDRYFLDRIATSVLAFEGDGRVERYSSADQALAAAKTRKPSANTAPKESPKPEVPPPAPATSLTYTERIEAETIMDKIAVAETRVAALEEAMAAPDLYTSRPEEAAPLAAKLQTAQQELAGVIDRWEYLESKK